MSFLSLKKTPKGYMAHGMVNGQRIRRMLKTNDIKIAKQRLVAIENEAHGRSASGESITFAALLREYEMDGRERSATARAHLAMIAKDFGDKRVSEIDREMVMKWIAGRRKVGNAPATIDRYVTLLYAVLNWGCEHGFLDNPPRRVARLSDGRGRDRVLTDEELLAILQELDEPYRLLTEFLATMGCRAGEALALKQSDVKDGRCTFWMQKGKGRKLRSRVVPMPEALAQRMAPLLDPERGDACVFQSDGKAIAYWSYYMRWTAACIRAGINDAHIHDLRRTRATRLIEGGVDVITVARILGHTNLQMLQSVYARVSVDHLARAMADNPVISKM